jgi:uncharacterized membrane protein
LCTLVAEVNKPLGGETSTCQTLAIWREFIQEVFPMARIEASVVINHTIEEVFAVIADYDQHAKWRDDLISAQITSPGPMGPGSTYTYNLRVMGRSLETSGEIVAYSPPEKVAWKATSGPFPMSGSTQLEQVGEGVRVTEVIEAEPGGFFKLAEPVLLRQQKNQMESDLKKLKQLMEQGLVQANSGA